MIQTFSEIYKSRDLLLAWTSRTIRARYQQSVLGGLWAFLQPAATVAIFTVIFTLIIPVDTGNIPYVVFSYSALVPWMLFTNSITDMVVSIVTNMNLVAKIYFPRSIIVLASLIARLLDFAIAFLVLIILMIYFGMPIFKTSWLLLPIILLIQLSFTLGIGLAGAALNVFYRDIKHLVALGMQLWLYATPIIYPVSLVPERFRLFYFLNPMAGIIEAYRSILLHGNSPDSTIYLSAAISLVVLIGGYWFFTRIEFRFADIV